ncbi:lanosterol synthase [Cryptococcus wingfieldii CBS 7118]|uniref:Terpene cyclase/mutase family member n=1 Tax=Cryptococcus wingfieldii CBS 7118 TaxID=1295528 RepID=A0A1E3JWR7_9TREE|nr:lanosterol synthase [Cryptococcus wingfieldii CBS 7118]ODO05233.1 lanosterol synthase [Cryptococcus wingfieldii CBS 7118]
MAYETPRTDLSAWRLVVGEDSHGQQKWVYLSDPHQREQCPQSTVEKYWLGLDTDLPELERAKTPLEAARNGYRFYKQIQSPDGHFSTEYGGPLFLIPGLVVALYVTGQSLRPEQQLEMRRYVLGKRRKEGGWGLHTAAPPTVFGTVMNYVALRILGMGPDEGPMSEIRALIHKMGGATGIPTWGKAWLCILGAYEWDGVGSVPPELLLLPDWVPFAPWRWWIHVRNVFTPMSYLYGTRFVGPYTPLVASLRQELYTQPYESIQWSRQGSNISPYDVYSGHSPVLRAAHKVLSVYEKLPHVPVISSSLPLRQVALDRAYQLIVYEDENTTYQTVGPVSKAFHIVCRYAREGADSDAFKAHLSRVDDFLWLSKGGLMMMGTNGSQLWDAGFMAQAAVETGLAEEEEFRDSALGTLDWLDKAQIRENPKWYKAGYRHRTKGAWPFSTPEQSYTVSDCTAEGLKAVMGLQHLDYTPEAVSMDRMKDAVDTLLSMQNANGGFASYELSRSGTYLELLNAAEVFGNIMIDYTYPECTTSALSGLKHFSLLNPTYRAADISRTIDLSIKYLHDIQRPDGSWYGSWGICFTYATMFALESLSIAGENWANSDRVKRACDFLVARQMEDGGWGETYMSCVTGEYTQHERSQVVQTAWAILALVYGQCPDKTVIEKATRLIMSRQQKDGRWEQEDTEGVFNKNCAIDYPAFKFIFCIWALGKADKYLRN